MCKTALSKRDSLGYLNMQKIKVTTLAILQHQVCKINTV